MNASLCDYPLIATGISGNPSPYPKVSTIHSNSAILNNDQLRHAGLDGTGVHPTPVLRWSITFISSSLKLACDFLGLGLLRYKSNPLEDTKNLKRIGGECFSRCCASDSVNDNLSNYVPLGPCNNH